MMTKSSWDAYNIRVLCPSGKMFITIAEDDNKPVMVFINIGKGGSQLGAWADSIARMITTSLQSGTSIVQIARELSGISSDKPLRNLAGLTVRSDPDAIAYGLLTYAADKQRELESTLGFEEDEDDLGLDDRGTFPR